MVTLKCTDNQGGSGCAKTIYQIDGSAYKTYNVPLSLPLKNNKKGVLKFLSEDKVGNRGAAKTEIYKLKPGIFVDNGEPAHGTQSYVFVTDVIPGHHKPRGVFFTKTVSLNVPAKYSKIVLTQDKRGKKPFGMDDWANLTVTGPSGKVQKVSLNVNGDRGAKIGEQYILSNVATLEPGINKIKVDLWNEFAPSGKNASCSSLWIVVH